MSKNVNIKFHNITMYNSISPAKAKEDYTITELTSIRTQLFIFPSEAKTTLTILLNYFQFEKRLFGGTVYQRMIEEFSKFLELQINTILMEALKHTCE